MAAGSIVPYPNPLNGRQVNFRCTGIYESSAITNHCNVFLHNILGNEVFSGSFRPSINIGPVSPGLYLLTIKNDKGELISVSKLIKN